MDYSYEKVNSFFFSAIRFDGKYVRLNGGHKKRWMRNQGYSPRPWGQVHTCVKSRILLSVVTVNQTKNSQQLQALWAYPGTGSWSFEIPISFPLDIYPEVGLLAHMVTLFLIF